VKHEDEIGKRSAGRERRESGKKIQSVSRPPMSGKEGLQKKTMPKHERGDVSRRYRKEVNVVRVKTRRNNTSFQNPEISGVA